MRRMSFKCPLIAETRIVLIFRLMADSLQVTNIREYNMIPNGLANTGPYAGFWAFLKSVDHALDRSLTLQPAMLTELDRERLLSLATFLETGLSDEGSTPAVYSLAFSAAEESDYGTSLDLKGRLYQIVAFEGWRPKLGFDKKLLRLVESLRRFEKADTLIAKDVPAEEFGVLRQIVSFLLLDAESAMNI